jgi:ribose transport system permease protein
VSIVGPPVVAEVREETAAQRRRRVSILDFGILVVLIAIAIGLAATSSSFRTLGNVANMLNQMSWEGIAACGATLAIISGGFDLSQGSVYAFCAILCVILAPHLTTFGAFAVALLIGFGFGALNGGVIAYGRINSFIATLATSYMILGLATVATGGNVETTSVTGFMVMNNTYGGITIAAWVFFAVALTTGVLLAFTRFGRGLYAIGGNPEAARLSGISIPLYRIAVFGISGACAAIAGIIGASQAGSADPGTSVANTLALTAIAATVVGGTSIMGGEGAIWRAVVGTVILELIANGFVLLNLNPVYEDIVNGGLILLAVAVDQLLRRRTT